MFDLNEPKDLYRIILETYENYVKCPNERDFLLLVLGFTHLREWIAESGYKEIQEKKRSGVPVSEGEEFFEEIHEMASFKAIQDLCNVSKHRVTRGTPRATSKRVGFQVGLSRCGDRLDQTYFLIDGRDSREYFIELIHKYNSWFSRNEG